MINPQNQRITKVIETLEQMNLFAAEEITQMEDFLNGTADESEDGTAETAAVARAKADAAAYLESKKGRK